MATTRMDYSATSAIGQMIAEFVDDTMSLLAEGRRLKAIFESMAAGGDWTRVETEVGGMSTGGGEAMYNTIVGAVAQIDNANVTGLSKLDKG